MSSSSSSSSSSGSDTDMKEKGRSRSGSPSGSGSDKSRASSRSKSPAKGGSSTRSSSSGSSSPKFVSATSSDGSGSKKSDASSTSSRGKKKLKAKDRKVSNKLAEKLKKSDEDSEDEQSSDDDRKKTRGKGGKATVKKSSPVKGKRGKKDESEEGEIASDDKEFDDGLDEDLIGDDDDRDRLEKMTEREREEELFKRAENRENLRKRFEIQKKLKQQQKLKKEEKKKISDESEEEEGERSDSGSESGERKSSPQKRDGSSGSESGSEKDEFGYGTIHDAKERSQDRRKNLDAKKYDKKSNALSELKAKRQERERRDQERAQKQKQSKGKGDDSDSDSSPGKDKRRDKDRKKRSSRRSRSRSSSSSSGPANRKSQRSSSSSSSSSRSGKSGSSSASDTERFHKLPSRQTQKYVETQVDLEPIRLSRFKLERFVHLPFFKKLVVGCFVRIGIGQHDGRSVYRAAEVVDVCETTKIYNIGKVRTNSGLKLRFGKQERVFRLEFISNSAITPQEFVKWRQTCEETEISLPTLEFVKTKAAEVKKALSYEFSSDDVDKIVAQKERFHKHPVNYAMHKARLMKERDAALTNGDEAKARDFDVKLNELEERAEELDKKRTSTISSVSLINDRNRKANVSKAEVAIMREIRHRRIHGFEANPFVRRKCNPRIVTKSKDGQVDEESLIKMAAQSSEQKENQKTDEKIEAKKKVDTPGGEPLAKKAKLQTANEPAKKEDLFDAHDFDIEIDVDTSSAGPVAAKPLLTSALGIGRDGIGGGSAARPTKRSLNLDDYKKKRGLI